MSLNEVWEAASATPFQPLVPKDSQFSVGFNLLLLGMDSSPLFRGPTNHVLFSIRFDRIVRSE